MLSAWQGRGYKFANKNSVLHTMLCSFARIAGPSCSFVAGITEETYFAHGA